MLSRRIFRLLCLATAAANCLGNLALLATYPRLLTLLNVPLPQDLYSYACVSGFSFTIGVLAFLVFLNPDENAPLLVPGALGKAIYAFFTFYFRVFHGLHWFYLAFGAWDALFTVVFLLFYMQLRSPDLERFNAGEILPGHGRSTGKALFVLYSLTGTGRSALQNVKAGLESAGYSTTEYDVQPVERELFSFPLTLLRFVRIMLRAIFRIPAKIEPLNIPPNHDYDLIVVFGQTWFVGVSAPIEAVFQDERNHPIFTGRDAATVNVCRGLRRRSQAMLVRWLERSGATVVGAHAYEHEGHEPSRVFSLFAYLAYGQTGRPAWLKWFLEPRYGLSDQAFANLKEFGTKLAKRTSGELAFAKKEGR
jgi:hypothetical protein